MRRETTTSASRRVGGRGKPGRRAGWAFCHYMQNIDGKEQFFTRKGKMMRQGDHRIYCTYIESHYSYTWPLWFQYPSCFPVWWRQWGGWGKLQLPDTRGWRGGGVLHCQRERVFPHGESDQPQSHTLPTRLIKPFETFLTPSPFTSYQNYAHCP